MIEVRLEPGHARQGIADCSRQRRFAGDTGQLGVQPDLQIIEDRLCLRLSEFDAAVRWRSTRFLLDGIELRDAPDGLVGDGRTLGSVDVDELAPDMSHAGDFTDTAGTVEAFEPSITIGVHPALILCKVILGMLSFAIWRELIPAGWWGIAAPRPLVSPIGPKARRCRLAGPWGQHLHRGVVSKDGLSIQHMPSDGIRQRFQKRRGFAHPVSQR